jgi:hypothetical protein
MGTDNKQKTTQLNELPRLQEFDIQRTLMPMSHASMPLSAVNSNNGIDSSVPSVNLRSYVALSRPGISPNIRNGKAGDVLNTVSREDFSALSGNYSGVFVVYIIDD